MIFMALVFYIFFFFMKRKCQLNCMIFSSNMWCCLGSGRCWPLSINDYSQHSKRLERKAPSPSAFDNGSDSNIITTGAETIHEKYNVTLLLISFPTWFLNIKLAKLEQFILNSLSWFSSLWRVVKAAAFGPNTVTKMICFNFQVSYTYWPASSLSHWHYHLWALFS